MLNPRCAEVPSAVPVSTVLVGESLSLAIHAPCRKCSPSFFKVAIENARDRGNLGPPGVALGDEGADGKVHCLAAEGKYRRLNLGFGTQPGLHPVRLTPA